MEDLARVLYLEDLLGEIILRLTISHEDNITPLFFVSKWHYTHLIKRSFWTKLGCQFHSKNNSDEVSTACVQSFLSGTLYFEEEDFIFEEIQSTNHETRIKGIIRLDKVLNQKYFPRWPFVASSHYNISSSRIENIASYLTNDSPIELQRAICSIIANNGIRPILPNVIPLFISGSIEIRHLLLQYILGILRTSEFDPDNRDKLIEYGVVPPLAALMTQFDEFQEQAVYAGQWLTYIYDQPPLASVRSIYDAAVLILRHWDQVAVNTRTIEYCMRICTNGSKCYTHAPDQYFMKYLAEEHRFYDLLISIIQAQRPKHHVYTLMQIVSGTLGLPEASFAALGFLDFFRELTAFIMCDGDLLLRQLIVYERYSENLTLQPLITNSGMITEILKLVKQKRGKSSLLSLLRVLRNIAQNNNNIQYLKDNDIIGEINSILTDSDLAQGQVRKLSTEIIVKISGEPLTQNAEDDDDEIEGFGLFD